MSIKQIDIDINNLFNLSYSFDSLKLYLKQVNENEQAMAKKIEDLEKKLKNMGDMQNAFQKGVMQNQNNFDKKLKTLDTTVKQKIKEVEEKSKQAVVVQQPKVEEKPVVVEQPKVEEKPAVEEPPKTEEINFQSQPEQLKPLEIEEENNRKQYNSSNNNAPSEEEPKAEEIVKEEEKEEDEEGYEFQDFNPGNIIQENLEIEELKRRVTDLEKKLKDSQSQMRFNFGSGLGAGEGDIESLRDSIKLLETSAADRLKDCENMKIDIDNLKVKVEDFNIADLFKDCKTEDGSIDSSKLLVSNLEAKVMKKLSIIDERIKKDEEGLFKTKNDINTLRNGQDSNQRSLASLKSDLKSLVEMIQSSSNSLTDKIDELDKKFTEMHVGLNKTVVENDKNCKNSIDQINKKLEALSDLKADTGESKVAVGGLSENDINLLKELSRKVAELEKNVKTLAQNPFLNEIKKEMNKIKAELGLRALTQDLYDLNDKVNEHGLKLSEVRDNVENLIKDSITNTENINFLTKKLEAINSTVNILKQGIDGGSSSKQVFFDTTKFLEINAFHEFVKRYDKDLEKLRKDIDELRRYFNDMAQAIKLKAEEDDLRNLDASLNAKIEELRIACNRKFADKTDTSKSIKYLDAQLKHIIEVYIKKADKGDNWLLAKKPIGYQCASCEAFIGDLKDKKDEFLSWNKYPIRDPTDNKAYRIGNGFSRMLNMLSLDVKNYEGKDGNLSDNEEKKKNITRVNTSLPTIPQKRKTEEDNKVANSDNEEEKERSASPSS